MKKAKLIRKKVLWLHSRLEQELGIEFEVERVKPRLYQFTNRGNGICLGYTQLQIGMFQSEDAPFCESNGFFLSREVDLIKWLLKCEYELEFPHRAMVRVEKEIRKWKREAEQRIREIKKRVITGGVQNVFGGKKVGKLNRRGNDQSASARKVPKCKRGAAYPDSRVQKSDKRDGARRSGNGYPAIVRPILKKKK